MKWRETIYSALNSVRSNLLRATLTIFIIAFGIMALVGILTAIDAAIFSLNDNFGRVGANSFSIRPDSDGPRRRGGGKDKKQAENIDFKQALLFQSEYNYPATVSISFRANSFTELRYKSKESNPNFRAEGVDENYISNNGYTISLGRNFTRSEINSNVNKVIIGQDVVEVLFDDNENKAIDQVINIDNVKYKVIGVLESKGNSLNNKEDQVALLPITTAQKYYGDDGDYFKISVSLRSAEEVTAAEAVAMGVMRRVRKLKIGEENDFLFIKSDSLIGIIKENTAMLRGSAIGIGLITLLGAAIGLMNIMLVTVTERTKEIGIHKALGATSKNVLYQFLTEAVLICQLGGIVGIILGIAIGNVVTFLLGGNFLIPWVWMFLGVVLCIFVGVLSGIYPALRASKMDPIESLRYE